MFMNKFASMGIQPRIWSQIIVPRRFREWISWSIKDLRKDCWFNYGELVWTCTISVESKFIIVGAICTCAYKAPILCIQLLYQNVIFGVIALGKVP